MAYKSPNACNQCHSDKDAAWADQQVRAWWPRDYQAPLLRVAGLVDAARKGNWGRLPEILSYLTSADRDEVYATALIRLLAGCEDQRKWPVLLEALKDSRPLVRAAAAGALDHFPTPETLKGLLAATRDEYRLVRVRAAASLAGVPRPSLSDAQRGDLQRATDEFLVVVQARPDDSASHHNLGNFYMEQGELDRAVVSFERAFQLLPDNAASLVNASIAYNLAGQNEKARDCLRRALKAEPKNAAANLNLGLLLGEMGRPDEAQTALRAAFKSDPQSATAAYNLGVILAGDRPAEAIEWCRTAYALRPKEPKYAYTLAFFLHAQGNRDEAIALLRSMTDTRVPYMDAFAFLGRIYEEGGFTDQAIALYRLGASIEEFPPAAREQFLLRAEAMSKR
jgi:Flp pilus assembly protein TadD